MIRLQLLPDYVFEGEKIVRALVVCLVLLLAETGGMLFWMSVENNRLENMTRQKTTAEANKTQVDGLNSEISAAKAAVAPIDNKRNYMISLRDYSDGYPERLKAISGYLYERAEVLSASVTERSVSLNVRTKTTEDIARIMMNLRRAEQDGLLAPQSISVSGVTGWPNPTSPRGWGTEAQRRMDLPAGVSPSDLRPVNSGSRNLQTGGAQQQGGGGPAGIPGVGGQGGGGGEVPGLGGDGQRFSNFVLDFGRSSKSALQMLMSPRQAAMLEYIEPSDEPPDQPYLQLTITATWARPMVPPAGTDTGQGGMGGFGGPGMGMGIPPMVGSGSGGPMPGAAGP